MVTFTFLTAFKEKKKVLVLNRSQLWFWQHRDMRWNSISPPPTLLTATPLCLSPSVHRSPATTFTLQRECEASVYNEEPRALCRVVLSNNKQWRQRLSVGAGKREGEGAKTGIKGRGGGEADVKAALCETAPLVCQLLLFMCHSAAKCDVTYDRPP